MKELDLLLGRLLARGFEDLSEHQLLRLEELLDHPDQDLLAWLSGGADPEDEALSALVRWIRERIGVDPCLTPGRSDLSGRPCSPLLGAGMPGCAPKPHDSS